MYTITIDNQTHSTTDSQAVAIANYRALARQYANKSVMIKLLKDGELMHERLPGKLLLDTLDEHVTANDILQQVMRRYDVDAKQLKALLKQTELTISGSRIDGWLRPADDRRYVQMHGDELLIVLDTLLTESAYAGYSPTNLRTLIARTGLSQAKFAEAIGESIKNVEGWIAPTDRATHRSMSHSAWNELTEKVKKLLMPS